VNPGSLFPPWWAWRASRQILLFKAYLEARAITKRAGKVSNQGLLTFFLQGSLRCVEGSGIDSRKMEQSPGFGVAVQGETVILLSTTSHLDDLFSAW
jgi:hypothetical protein